MTVPDESENLLAQFEKAVYDPSKQRLTDATVLLHQLLSNIEKLGGDTEATEKSFFYPRLAFAISALMLDENYQLTLPQYQLLCGSHAALASVFACTPLQTSDHIISHLADISDFNNLRFANTNVLMKCLLCYSLDSQYELDLESLTTQFPEIIASVVLGQLCCDIYSRERVERKINQLLSKEWPVFSEVTPTLPMVLTTSNAWMNCSYSTTESKHLVKRDLNAMIRNGLKAQGVDDAKLPARKHEQDKPVVIVPIELFTSYHAMYRCFSRVVEKLKQRFHVIGVSPINCIDDEAEKIFDEVMKFDPAKAILNINELVEQIRDHAPDIIYYPSLGMANYTLLLANLRLAPIQCFTLGHPASSFIETIDYVIVQEQDFTDEAIYSETVILTGNETSPTINRVLETVSTPSLREQPDSIRIAVTSKQMKINHTFLLCCRAISDSAEKTVEFHFFPGTTGYHFEFVRHEILRVLPGSKVYPTTDYDSYIKNMDQCDIRLGTFPFGGANTNMDCFGLGIPFVILDGRQPHSHSDTAQIIQADLPKWLIADNIDQYIGAALRLIEDDSERVNISRQMIQLHKNDFFYKQSGSTPLLFVQTLLWLYKNHEVIKRTDKRVWSLADQHLTDQHLTDQHLTDQKKNNQ